MPSKPSLTRRLKRSDPPVLRCSILLTLMISLMDPSLSAGGRLLAQDTDSRVTGRVPVTIALVDEVDGSHDGAVILRRADRHPNDVIMIARREANAEIFSAAVFTLLVTRRVLGDVPEAEARIPVLREHGPRAWRSRIMPRLGRLLGGLRSAEPAWVHGVGLVRSVTVWLPADYEMRLSPMGEAGTAPGGS